jgi:hypothetical protein
MPCRPCRWGRVSRWFRLVGRRLRRGLRRGVVLRRRRDDDHHRGKILGGRRKRRRKRDERETRGKPNGVCLHGRVPCLRFARGAARPTDARAREENPIWSRHPIRLLSLPVAHLSADLPAWTAARRFLRIALKDRRGAFLPYPAQKAEFSDPSTKDEDWRIPRDRPRRMFAPQSRARRQDEHHSAQAPSPRSAAATRARPSLRARGSAAA